MSRCGYGINFTKDYTLKDAEIHQRIHTHGAEVKKRIILVWICIIDFCILWTISYHMLSHTMGHHAWSSLWTSVINSVLYVRVAHEGPWAISDKTVAILSWGCLRRSQTQTGSGAEWFGNPRATAGHFLLAPTSRSFAVEGSNLHGALAITLIYWSYCWLRT